MRNKKKLTLETEMFNRKYIPPLNKNALENCGDRFKKKKEPNEEEEDEDVENQEEEV